jgi:hypothetical protein
MGGPRRRFQRVDWDDEPPMGAPIQDALSERISRLREEAAKGGPQSQSILREYLGLLIYSPGTKPSDALSLARDLGLLDTAGAPGVKRGSRGTLRSNRDYDEGFQALLRKVEDEDGEEGGSGSQAEAAG